MYGFFNGLITFHNRLYKCSKVGIDTRDSSSPIQKRPTKTETKTQRPQPIDTYPGKPPKPQPPSLLTTGRRSTRAIFFIRNNRHRLRLGRRRKLTPRPNLRPVPPKDDGDRDEDQRDATEKRAGPVDAERVEHVRCEEGEHGAEEGSQEGVCCYS